jgi:protein TonB
VKENMKWPSNLMEYRGIIYVKCIINEKGEIINPNVVKGLCDKCDKEALRLVQAMPNWKPAKKNGKNITTETIIPIDFSIYDNS